MSDEAWQQRLRAAWSPNPTARGRAPSPTTDELWQVAHGDLPTERAIDVLDRALDDPAALAEFHLASAIAAATQSAQPSPRATPTRGFGGFAIVGALAAAMLAVWWVRPRTTGDTEPVYRDAATPGLSSTTPAVVRRDACVLRWRTADTANVTFDITVSTDEPAVVARAQHLSTAFYEVPAAALATLPAGAVLLWQIEAVAADGARTRSQTFTTTLE